MSIRKASGPPATRWTTDRAPPKVPHLPIERPKPREERKYIILGEACHGHDVHWDDGSTEPCCGKDQNCYWCHEGRSARRVWFLLVLDHVRRKICILQISNGAYEQNPQLRHGAGQLRGRWIRTWRVGLNPNARQVVAVGEDARQQGLPAEIDVREHLAYVWQFRRAPRIG